MGNGFIKENKLICNKTLGMIFLALRTIIIKVFKRKTIEMLTFPQLEDIYFLGFCFMYNIVSCVNMHGHTNIFQIARSLLTD